MAAQTVTARCSSSRYWRPSTAFRASRIASARASFFWPSSTGALRAPPHLDTPALQLCRTRSRPTAVAARGAVPSFPWAAVSPRRPLYRAAQGGSGYITQYPLRLLGRAAGDPRLRHRTTAPAASTSAYRRSDLNIAIMRAFVRLWEMLASHSELVHFLTCTSSAWMMLIQTNTVVGARQIVFSL